MAFISTFANWTSLYEYCLVPLLVFTETSVIYLSSFKSYPPLFSIKPISTLETDLSKFIVSVTPTYTCCPANVIFCPWASELLFSFDPLALYFVILYFEVSYLNTTR